MLERAVKHLLQYVLPAATDYDEAERGLTRAHQRDDAISSWEEEAEKAKRCAANLAIAIDGLTDRSTDDLGFLKTRIRKEVSNLCCWPATGAPRSGAINRVRAVADAYRHGNLNNLTLPISSDEDVLVVGLGWGLDSWGVGKYSGVEVLICEKCGDRYKFLADAPVAVAAWFRYVGAHGAALPKGPYHCCGLQVHPYVNLSKQADDIVAMIVLGPNKAPSREEIRRLADDATCGALTSSELDTLTDMVASRLRDDLKT